MTQLIYPLGDEIAQVELIDSMGNDKKVVNAARVSYLNDNQLPWNSKDERLLLHLLKDNHGSVLEHCTLTYRVKMPLFIIQQVLRHRVGTSYNQSSRRYTVINESEFYTPTNFRVQSANNKQASIPATLEEIQKFSSFPTVEMWNASVTKLYEDAWRYAYNKYDALVQAGVAREQARGVLPVSQYGEFYFTLNLRSLFHFLELRLEEHAQYEIRLMGYAMLDLIQDIYPETIKIWRSLHGGLLLNESEKIAS